MPTTLLPYGCGAVLVSSLLLGGGTTTGFLSDAALQFLAIPLLLMCLWHMTTHPLERAARRAVVLASAILLVPLLQLIPLPPAIWTALPNREPIVAAYGLLERSLPWMPISVSPQATWLSATSLLPPLSIFIATLHLGYRDRRHLSLVLLAFGVVSVFVGLSQVAQGPKSALRFFEFTNQTEAVGFFANRNHFAALLYAQVLFVAAWSVEAAVNFEDGRRRADTAWTVALAACLMVIIALVAGQAMARSRAGIGLTILALFGAFALALTDRRSTSTVTPTRLLVGAIVLAVLLAVQYALYRVMQRFGEDPLKDARIAFARATIAAAKSYMPFGSGMGTFVPVYSTLERPQDAMADTYANRAHNDILELWLEAGAIGLALLAAFLAWLAVAVFRVWRNVAPQARQIDVLLMRAASVVLCLIIAHSLVDYPLRTAAIMAILAYSCALLIEPPAAADEAAIERTSQTGARRHVPRAAPAASPLQAAPVRPLPGIAGTPLERGERWGDGVDWPEEWREDAKSSKTDAARGRAAPPKPPSNE